MRIVKCPYCYDEREIDEKVIIAICGACREEMIIKKEEIENGNKNQNR